MSDEHRRANRISKEFRPKPRTPGVILDETLRSRATEHRERLHVDATAAHGSVEFLRQMELSLRPREVQSSESPQNGDAAHPGVHRDNSVRWRLPRKEEVDAGLLAALKEELNALQSENAALQLFCARLDNGCDEVPVEGSSMPDGDKVAKIGSEERELHTTDPTSPSQQKLTCQAWRAHLVRLLNECEVAAARHCDNGRARAASRDLTAAAHLQRVAQLKVQSAELLQQCSLLEAEVDAYRQESRRDAAPTSGLAWDIVDEVERAFPVALVDPVPRMAWQLRRDLWTSWKAEAVEQKKTSEEVHFRLAECVLGLREQLHMVLRHLSSGAAGQ